MITDDSNVGKNGSSLPCGKSPCFPVSSAGVILNRCLRKLFLDTANTIEDLWLRIKNFKELQKINRILEQVVSKMEEKHARELQVLNKQMVQMEADYQRAINDLENQLRFEKKNCELVKKRMQNCEKGETIFGI